MSGTPLRLVLEGDDLSPGDVGRAFVEFSALFAEIDRDLSLGGARSLRLRVAGLEAGSASLLALAEPLEDALDIGPRVAGALVQGLGLVEREGLRPVEFSETALEHLKALADLSSNGVRGIKVEAPAQQLSARVTLRTAANLERVLAQGYSIGSIEGSLDTVSVHGQPFCTVFDCVTGRAVRCYFDHALLPDIVNLLGVRVSIHGRLRRDPSGRPTQLRSVDSVVRLGTPAVAQLAGAFAGMEGSTRDYLAEIRGE